MFVPHINPDRKSSTSVETHSNQVSKCKLGVCFSARCCSLNGFVYKVAMTSGMQARLGLNNMDSHTKIDLTIAAVRPLLGLSRGIIPLREKPAT